MLRAALQLLFACCALPPIAAHAQLFRDPDEKPWVEAEIRLPPYPKPGNLIQFNPDITGSTRFYIDPESISIGSDEVVRYTLVIKSSSGGENISYEGMRCRTREQKYYAFGRRDGTWSNARSSEWRQIDIRGINSQHRALYWDYFCPGRTYPISSSKDAINRLKYGVPSTKDRDD